MKSTSIITSLISRVRIPATILEDIVNHRTKTTRYNYPVSRIDRDIYCKDLNTIHTYSIQSTVKGNLEVQFSAGWESIDTQYIPVAPSFLITCIRNDESKYRMALVASLN